MRVITGTARGKRLKEPRGFDMRPTTDLVKESVFNIIQFDIEGRRVLDLFAGTGQLGIEALSRGAESAVFVDSSQESIKLIKDNLDTTGLGGRARVVRGEAADFLNTEKAKFDIIFLDPPYDCDLLENSLKTIAEIDILSRNGIIICESRTAKELPVLPDSYQRSKDYRYGRIKLTLFTRE